MTLKRRPSVWQQMLEETRKRGAVTLADIDDRVAGYTLGSSYHIVLLGRLAAGPVEHQPSGQRWTFSSISAAARHMPRANIQKYREGVIVGSACEAGELFRAVLEGADEKKLSRIARFYDYLEIQPVGNNAFLIREGRVKDVEELRELNRVIVRLGEKLGLLWWLRATCIFSIPRTAYSAPSCRMAWAMMIAISSRRCI